MIVELKLAYSLLGHRFGPHYPGRNVKLKAVAAIHHLLHDEVCRMTKRGRLFP
ncbi:MAG: hypothetical protein M3Q03_08965 [Chloroflexota bacterium]|nr:hypothetical protein [Chloroflexota bacterium]